MATVLAKVGLQRLQPILDAQEVDLPALLELDEEVCLLTIAIMTLVRINRLKPLLLKGLERVGGSGFNPTGSTSPSVGQDQAEVKNKQGKEICFVFLTILLSFGCWHLCLEVLWL